MTPDRWQHIIRLFEEIAELPVDAQAAALEKACKGDRSLYDEVWGMLAADNQPPSILDASLDELTDLVPEAEALPEDARVDIYRLVRKVGSGGMGIVYEAQRDDAQFRQRVALKRIKRGMDTEEIVRRFRYERQILASLEHPNIARLLDGGVHENQPYFVMEFVEGESITAYADRNKLDIEGRLALFVSACRAVQHAHQNLVVHRDLKPSNMLVTAAGEVKLLDFGIARLLEPGAAVLTAPNTQTGHRVMTPAYASPEQLLGESVTTATDVYSLGVVLYELLTGRRPFARQGVQFDTSAIPIKPSTAISKPLDDSDTSVDAISEARNSSLDRLTRRLKGDLDTIVLKALQPRPERRYQSAEQLLDDIKRHLAGLPVLAQPDSFRYRAGKFLVRHRFGVAAAFMLLLVLVGFAGAMAYQQSQTVLERDTAEEVATFLEQMFAAADPFSEERLDTMRVQTLLERGAAQVEDGLENQPVVQARMLNIIGRVYGRLGLNDQAQPVLEQALAIRRSHLDTPHPDIAETLIELGDVTYEQGDYDASNTYFEEALGMRKALLGENNEVVAEAMRKRGLTLHALGELEAAGEAFRGALSIQRGVFGEKHLEVASTLSTMASLLDDQGDYDESEQYHVKSLEIRRALFDANHPNLAVGLNNLAIFLRNRHRYDEAEPLLREAIAIDRATLSPEHPNLINDLNTLASVLRRKGDYEAAEPIFVEVLALRRKVLGPDHPDVSITLDSYARVLKEKGDFTKAERLQREAIEIARQAHGDEHISIAITTGSLASILRAGGDYARALPVYREALRLYEGLFSADHPNVSVLRSNLAGCLIDLGRYAEAEPLLLQSYRVLEPSRGMDDRLTQSTIRFLIRLYESWGKEAEADSFRAKRTGE